MHISDEGLVAGSVNRADLAAAYEAASGDAVKANLAAAGAEHGMVVEDGKLIDPSEQEPEPENDDESGEVVDADGPEGPEPPRSGPGSGRDAWVAYAESQGVEVTEDMTRDDIVAAVDAAKESD